MIKFLLLAATCMFHLSITAQKKVNTSPLFLIPYNNHGVWGWCDTTGKIVIKPQFKSTYFFRIGSGLNPKFEAEVKTLYGNNVYVINEGLQVPEKYNLIKTYSLKNQDKRWSLISSNGKYGAYQIQSKKILLNAEWDTIIHIENLDDVLFLKIEGSSTFSQYSFDTDSLVNTDIDSIFVYPIYEKSANLKYYEEVDTWIFKHTDGSFTYLKNNESINVTEEMRKEIMSTSNNNSEIYLYEDKNYSYNEYSDPKFVQNSTIINASTPMTDTSKGIVTYIFDGKPVPSDYKLIYAVTKKKGKLGVISTKGEVLLPNEYDELVFYYERFVMYQIFLKKRGKSGFIDLKPPYTFIQAKYDVIPFFAYEIRKQGNNYFQVYEVRVEGQKGYIGLDGTEYFKL